MTDKKYKKLYPEIQKILITGWGPANEYDTYVMQIVGMLVAGTDAGKIQAYLENVESSFKGTTVDKNKSKRMAENINDLSGLVKG